MISGSAIMSQAMNRGEADWQWFCIQTKPHCEDLATVNLVNRQIIVLNPKVEEVFFRDGKRRRRAAPLFPCYIFANLVLGRDYYKAKWAPGVKRIVGSGDTPVPLDYTTIEAIIDKLQSGEYIKIKRPKPGDKVVVRGGAFSGLTGVFESYCSGRERVNVLLELLHQQVKVELDYALIEPL